MSLQNFIPTVWSALILSSLDKALVYGQPNVVNRDYEGLISQQGDSVKINSIGDVTVKTYTKNTDIDDPETFNDAGQMLNITEADYFNFAVDDVDKAQTNTSVMEEAMRRAAYSLRDVADQFIASHHVNVPAGNLLGDDTTPIVPTATTAYDKLVDLSVLLDEANVPMEGRFCVVPAWYHGLLLKDDRFVAAGTVVTDSILRNGMIGQAAGMNILKSNNAPNTAGVKYKIIAGHSIGFSFANQVTKVEAYRKEKGFSDGMKGLSIYGGKLVRPTAWAVLTANKS